MPAEFMMRRCWALRWNGTNGTEVAALVTSMDTDAATYVVFEEVPDDHLILRAYDGGVWVGTQIYIRATAPWVVCDLGAPTYELLSEDSKAARYIPGPDARPLLGVTAAPAYALRKAVGQANVGAMVLGASSPPIDVTLSKPMPLTTEVADVEWRVHAGVQVLAQVVLQNVANPIVLLTNGNPAASPPVPATAVTGVRFLVRSSGLASVAGILQCEVMKLVTT